MHPDLIIGRTIPKRFYRISGRNHITFLSQFTVKNPKAQVFLLTQGNPLILQTHCDTQFADIQSTMSIKLNILEKNEHLNIEFLGVSVYNVKVLKSDKTLMDLCCKEDRHG